MDKNALEKRIEDLRRAIDVSAVEFNKLVGRLQEAEMLFENIIDKEKLKDEVSE